MRLVCNQHRPVPNPVYNGMDLEWFQGRYCKLAFPEEKGDGFEYMWVKVTGLAESPDEELRGELVGKRRGSHGAGLHAFPGGHLDSSDHSLWSCGEREVLEETGMVVRCFSPDHYREDLFTTFDVLGDNKVYVTPYLVADFLHGGEHTKKGDQEFVRPLEDKCEAWEWVTLDRLVELVRTDEQKVWIPLPQVVFYLKQMWGVYNVC